MSKEILNGYAYLGDHRAVTVTKLGHRLLIDTRNIQSLSIVTHGEFDRKTTWAIEKLVKKGQRAVDVGANIGFFTLQLCAQVGPTGSVVAVEPNPELFFLMSGTLHINAMKKRCEALNVAALNERCKLELTWSEPEHGGGRLIVGQKQKGEARRATVDCVPLDEVLGDQPVDFIKIDTEGSESMALEGATRALERSPNCVVVTEWVPRFIAARSNDLRGAIDLVESRFSHRYLLERVGTLTPLETGAMENLQFSNLVLANQPIERRFA